ncbi:uncharacterized protein LOC111629088, partial [Centruroides sculpturatus]|uniref:uncharacterized protein LOC111629088 n=1 Tax=Centruroides sculpturatus TaxID=218467 RepID=UPI000C6E2B55
ITSTFDETGCSCYKFTCGCCAHLEVPKTYLNDTGCVNLTYLPNDYGLSFTITIDNKTIYSETISVHNPPPICFRAPHLKKYTDVCIRFYDLQDSKNKLHGCVELEARLYRVKLATYKSGCFNLGDDSFFSLKSYLEETLFSFKKFLNYVENYIDGLINNQPEQAAMPLLLAGYLLIHSYMYLIQKTTI